ncbi:angiopoietin-2-like [Gouania willdenowi]|uniref:angiopoietin-2-like n=1 Tax=Gouania willdenowi TaxID=441366 RepID=UPI00105656E2|nr:angiopoietin-2-like [Gouania willdenowi]
MRSVLLTGVFLLTGWCFQSYTGNPLTSDDLTTIGQVQDLQPDSFSGANAHRRYPSMRRGRNVADTERFRDDELDVNKDDYEDADWHPPSSLLESHIDLISNSPLMKYSDDTGRDDSNDPTSNRTPGSGHCGEFSSQLMPNGQCRLMATLPTVGNAEKLCPDILHCTEDVSHWLSENRNRKEQVEQLKEMMSALQEELRSHQHQVKALEKQRGEIIQLNSTSDLRLKSLEQRDAEADTLLHVHATLLQELQTQLRKLTATAKSVSLNVGGTVTVVRRNRPSLSMQNSQPPGGRPLPACPNDCASLYHSGVRRSGVYTIVVATGVALSVYCDMSTEGGGWTVFQRRRDGSVSFNRRWSEYRDGFGEPHGEHWLGNQHLHQLSNQGQYSLRIHLQDWSHAHKHALYSTFRISDEDDHYRLHVSGFSGSVQDSFSWYHDQHVFSTPDTGHICAEISHAGWWFHQCFYANLNGVYYKGGHYSLKAQNQLGPDGIVWFSWKDSDFYSMKAVTMMTRPQNFRSHQSP